MLSCSRGKKVPACTLPLTGKRCVDLIITELCVLEMDPSRRKFVLKEVAPGVTVDEVKAKTAAQIVIPDNVATVSV